MRDLVSLPKAHLHIHLEGGMRTATLADLACGYGMDVPEILGFGSFTAFVATYGAACGVLQTPDDLRRLVTELVEDNARAGAAWVEPAFHPPNHVARLGPNETSLEIVLDALTVAGREHGIGTGLMLSANRTVDPADALGLARLAVRYKDEGVVSFGLANDEGPYPPEPFEEAFRLVRDAGILSTPHAGELAGPASIVGALDALGADRIQHGVRALEDPALVARLAESGVCLDVCPSSNIALSVFPSLAEHPLPALLDAGVRCSINADDPLLFGPNVLEEYELCRSAFGFDDARLAYIARCSVTASGAPEALKQVALAGVDAWLGSSAG